MPSTRAIAVFAVLTAAVGCGTGHGTGLAADYTLSLTPATLTIVRGLSGSTTVAISRTNFTGAVTLSLAGAPVGTIRPFSPGAPTGNSSMLTINVGATVAPGVYNLTVNGAATPGNRSTALTLTVNSSGGGSGITTVVVATELSCALSASGQAYCWGVNGNGRLGGATSSETCVDARFGYSNPCSTRPLTVNGGLTFAMLSAQNGPPCGLTASGAAYCWGLFGADTTAPTPLAGGLTLAELSGLCGVTTDGAAYCWGGSAYGALGNGTTTNQLVPTPVVGGLTFTSLSAGDGHTCGVTMSGAAYCWGYNAYGQLGDGTTTDRLVPTPVA